MPTITTFDQPRDRRKIATLRNVRNRVARSDNPSRRDQRILCKKALQAVRGERFVFEFDAETEAEGGQD